MGGQPPRKVKRRKKIGAQKNILGAK